MEMNFSGPDGTLRTFEQIELDQISEMTLKKHLNKGNEVLLITKEVTVLTGNKKMPVGTVVLDNESKIKDVGDKIIANTMFEYNNFQTLEPYGEIVHRNGYKLINTTVEINKEDILIAAVVPL